MNLINYKWNSESSEQYQRALAKPIIATRLERLSQEMKQCPDDVNIHVQNLCDILHNTAGLVLKRKSMISLALPTKPTNLNRKSIISLAMPTNATIASQS